MMKHPFNSQRPCARICNELLIVPRVPLHWLFPLQWDIFKILILLTLSHMSRLSREFEQNRIVFLKSFFQPYESWLLHAHIYIYVGHVGQVGQPYRIIKKNYVPLKRVKESVMGQVGQGRKGESAMSVTMNDLAAVMEKEPYLSSYGIECRSKGQRYERNRNVLLESGFNGFRICCEWLSRCATRKTINTRIGTSYTLKELVEEWAGCHVTNGAFIAAVIHMGIPHKCEADFVNIHVGLSSRCSFLKDCIVIHRTGGAIGSSQNFHFSRGSCSAHTQSFQ